MSNKAITWAYGRNTVRDGSKLKPGPKFTLVTLADMADQEHSCFPGYGMLAELTGSSESAVREHMKALRQAGFVREERRHKKNGARTSNRYYLAVDELEGRWPVEADDAQDEPENVAPESGGTIQEPSAGIRDDLAPESGERSAGIRRALKEEPSVEPPVEPSDTYSGANAAFDLDVPEPADPIAAAFERFWKIYPRREAKKAAEEKFRQVVPKQVSIDQVLAAVEEFARYLAATGREREHMPHPKTWLHQHRWNDELTIPTQSAGGAPPGRKLTNAERAIAEFERDLAQRHTDRQELTS